MEKTMTANQFAKATGLYPMQVTRMIEKGEIKAIKKPVVKCEYKIPATEVNKFKK